MTRHDAMLQYAATENSPANRTVVFESGAETLDGIMRAAKKAIAETYHEDDNPLFKNGYTVVRVSPIAIVPGIEEGESEGEG